MKKRSFKVLEQEMLRNGLLLNEENLKSISGGKTASQEHNPAAGVVADPFTNTDTTIVQEGSLSQNAAVSHSAGSLAQSFVHQGLMTPMGQTDDPAYTTQEQTTLPNNQAWLDSIVDTYFADNVPSNTYLTSGDIPAGYTLNPDGSFHNTQTGETAYGVTFSQIDRAVPYTTIYISPYMFSGGDDAHRAGLIGHGIIHAVNIQEHSEMYASDRQQFNLNSEYAGYRYQYNYALSIGDTVTANACQT